MTRNLVAAGWIVLLLCGCEENVYELQLEPRGADMIRELTCWRHERDQEGQPLRRFPQADLDRVAQAYAAGARVSEPRKYHFEAMFGAVMPQEIGGAGSYTYVEGTLGSVGGYSERFRGDDDVASRIEQRTAAAERLIGILAGWLESRCSDTPEWQQLDTLLRHDLRRDARNVALLWMLPNLSAEDVSDGLSVENDLQARVVNSFLARAPHYLWERDYITQDTLSDVLQVWYGWEHGSDTVGERKMARFFHDLLIRKAGITRDSQLGKRLEQILGGDAPFTSLRAHIQTLPEWAALEQQWQERRKHDPAVAPPDPLEALAGLLTQVASGNTQVEPLLLRVELRLPAAPVMTNGTWDPDAGVVRWATRTDEANRLPKLCTAWWAEPAKEAQTLHLGRLVLQGQALLDYTFAEEALAADHVGVWRTFMQQLRPGDSLEESLKTMADRRVESSGLAQPAKPFQPVCEILLEALQGDD